MRRVFTLVAFFTALITYPQTLLAVDAIPSLKSRVTDQTATLTAADKIELESELAELERTKGAQVAVLIVPSTGDEAIEEYAFRAAEQWKLGRPNTDDGILFVVAKNDHHMRIEVGYGLEGAVPDARANQIMDDLVTPQFRAGNFAEGIRVGIKALGALVRGESLPPPQNPWQSSPTGSSSGNFWLALIFFALFFSHFLRAAFGGGLGALITACLVTFFMTFFVSLGIAIFCGVLAGLLTLFSGDSMRLNPYGRRAYSGYGGFPRGGGFGGWSSGGGGFSGGGGRFGGGGASGSW